VIIEAERKAGHSRIAGDLETILNSKPKHPQSRPKSLSPLPSSKRDASPLFQEILQKDLRHQMVLPAEVEMRLSRIEREFAARKRLANHGLQPSRRILLFGPPGCGKSLGAERLAWNTGLPLLKVRFDTLLSSFFGETHTNLRKVFDIAEERSCAIFLDECDTLARTRSERNDVGEATRITNALLEMLESYRGDGLVIAATNLDSALDPALIRRFDEVIRVPLPTTEEIEGVLRMNLSAIRTEKKIVWKALAGEMDGMSCSEVAQVAWSAAKKAVLESRKTVKGEDLRHALDETHKRQQWAGDKL